MVYRSNRLTTTQFIQNAQTVHGAQYDYSLVNYVTNRTKIQIICKVHGVFLQTPSLHVNDKRGCVKCNKEYYTTESFVEKSHLVHSKLYDYTLSHYTAMNKSVDVICTTHGVFSTTPSNHIHRKSGCPKCGENVNRHTLAKFVQSARLVHGDTYDYSLVDYVNSKTSVIILCHIHGPFNQMPDGHVNSKKRCPACVHTSKSSRIAIRWLDMISNKENIHIQHAGNGGELLIPGTRLKVDGYCAETNTVYEFHGSKWHGDPSKFKPSDTCHPFNKEITAGELYDRTISRENIIQQLGYTLVTCWESAFILQPK
jgi:hypothetical protein